MLKFENGDLCFISKNNLKYDILEGVHMREDDARQTSDIVFVVLRSIPGEHHDSIWIKTAGICYGASIVKDDMDMYNLVIENIVDTFEEEHNLKGAVHEKLTLNTISMLKAFRNATIEVTYDELCRDFILSAYNENTDDEFDYYMREGHLNVGDTGYLYRADDDEVVEIEIIKIIRRSDNEEYYDNLVRDEDVLLFGEKELDADTSAEFITDDDSMLVWFKYGDNYRSVLTPGHMRFEDIR